MPDLQGRTHWENLPCGPSKQAKWHKEHVPKHELDQEAEKRVLNDCVLHLARLSFRRVEYNSHADEVDDDEERDCGANEDL